MTLEELYIKISDLYDQVNSLGPTRFGYVKEDLGDKFPEYQRLTNEIEALLRPMGFYWSSFGDDETLEALHWAMNLQNCLKDENNA